jgi:hypothetical protein
MDRSGVQYLIKKKNDRITFMHKGGKLTSDVWQSCVQVKVDDVLTPLSVQSVVVF